MYYEKNKTVVLKCNQLTEAETVKRKNGRALRHEWSKFPQEAENFRDVKSLSTIDSGGITDGV